MRKILLAAAGAVFLAACARAGETKLEGWYVAGEASWLRVGNNDLIVATPSDSAGNPSGELLAMDLGSHPSYKLAIGYKNAEWGDFSVSYWGYSQNAGVMGDNLNGYYPGFGSQFNSNYYDPVTGFTSPPFYNRVDGRVELKSYLLDFTWARQFAKTEHSEWAWSVGLRHWSMEQNESLDGCRYDASTRCNFAFPYRFEQDLLLSDSRGTGLTLGINGQMHFSERFWISSSLKFAFLSGRNHAETHITNYWPYPSPSTFYYDNLTSKGKNRTFTQIEADARLNSHIVAGLNGFVGYQFKKFDNAVTTIGSGANAFSFGAGTHTHDLDMQGLVAGLSYIW